METILDEHWATALREVEATALDLPRLVLDCSRLITEIKDEIKQRHIQWMQRPFPIGTTTALERYSFKDSTVDFDASNEILESGISLGHKRKRDQLEKGCDHEQDGKSSCASGNIPLAQDHSPQVYRTDDRSKHQPEDEPVRGLLAYHSVISNEFQESKEQLSTKARVNRLEYLERSLSKNISVLADCSSILELFLPQALSRQLEASSSTTIATVSVMATVGYVLTLWVPRVFARPYPKSRDRSRTPLMDLCRVQGEIRSIGQGADEILSAIGRYHAVQCGTKRHREQLDEHHLVHLLSWTREVQAKSVALCQLLLQLEPLSLKRQL